MGGLVKRLLSIDSSARQWIGSQPLGVLFIEGRGERRSANERHRSGTWCRGGSASWAIPSPLSLISWAGCTGRMTHPRIPAPYRGGSDRSPCRCTDVALAGGSATGSSGSRVRMSASGMSSSRLRRRLVRSAPPTCAGSVLVGQNPGRCGGAGRNAELGAHVGDVPMDCVRAESQPFGDLGVGQAAATSISTSRSRAVRAGACCSAGTACGKPSRKRSSASITARLSPSQGK